MQRLKLSVVKRSVLGKKVKKLRKEGHLPANIYGKDVKSTAVQVAQKDFDSVYKEAGETGLIDLDFEDKLRPVLIHNVQIDHMSRLPLHADFYQVNLKEKVKTMVPILVKGEAKAVTDNVGLLLQPLTEIEVEALPEKLPESIDVDVSGLAAVDNQITVKELSLPQGVTVLTQADQVVVKIAELVTKEAQEQAAKEAAAAEAAKATTETPEAEGAEKKEEPTAEEKPAEAQKPAEEPKE